MKNFKEFLLTAASKLLILLVVASLISVPAVSSAKNIETSYVIKLSSANEYSKLLNIADKIEKRFSQTASETFQNIYTFRSGVSRADLERRLFGVYEYLEAQRFAEADGVVVNDPGFTQNFQNIDGQWGLVKAGFTEAWQQTVGSVANVVAVIDTGIDETHEDLRSINFVPGFDFTKSQPLNRGANYDDNGHGTLVAGILGATANNGEGIAGANWQVSIMSLKVLDAQGKGDTTAVAEAIVWAADHGAQFINMSLGGLGFDHDTTLANAITHAFNKNLVIVSAAGNDAAVVGGNLDMDPVFPICNDNNQNMVIGVAATDQNDIKPDFSNYGKNCVDVTAPGKRILSTINFDPLTNRPSPNSYAYASGTSLAVPFVVAEAALIKSMFPQASNEQIRDRIISTADSVDNLNLSQCSGSSCRGHLGAGRINALKSLQTAITPPFLEGDLIKITDLGGLVYQIMGGQKRPVSSFVYNQRFANSTFKSALLGQLSDYPDGPYVTPDEGTLVKYNFSPTIYMVLSGQKFPITSQVFKQRGFSFTNVQTLNSPELDSWVSASLLAPTEGTLVKSALNRTVYWVVGQVLHPINNKFFVEKGLNVFPILVVTDADIAGFTKGEAYIR